MIYTNDAIKKINQKKEKRKKIIKLISFIILLTAVVFATIVFYEKFIKRHEKIQIVGYEPFIVMTGSMEPEIKAGDMVIIKKSLQEEIKIGDTITYLLENGKDTVTHRVVDIIEQNGEKLYQTKGDNNNSPDPDLVSHEKVLGKVIITFSRLGKIVAYAFTGTGFTALCLVVVAHYLIVNEKRTRIVAREEARRRYNKPKYTSKTENT